MSKDLTAIFVAGRVDPAALTPEWVESVVRQRGRPVFLRVAPLRTRGLVQIEVSDIADGLPAEDRELYAALSARGAATFVHVNHEAKQAIVHAFDAGAAGESLIGAPGPDFDARIQQRLGCDLDALHDADDKSRVGIGVVASHTAALLPGRSLALPVGMPSALGNFSFHDRAIDHDGGAERCTFFAFDRPLVPALESTSGDELAQIIASGAEKGAAPAAPELVAALRVLGERTIKDAEPAARGLLIRAVEMLVLGSGRVFAGGDRADFWDERVLPLLSLGTSEPVIDADDLESLASARSVLHALVEVVPSTAPPGGPGSVLEGLAEGELGPLLPVLSTDGAYAGSILALDPARLTAKVRTLDGDTLSAAVGRIERAWFHAQVKAGQPPGDEAFAAFRKELNEIGQGDIDRVLRHLSELRIVLEVAAVNDLVVALAFYG